MRSALGPIGAHICVLLDAADRAIAESPAIIAERHRMREEWNKYLKDANCRTFCSSANDGSVPRRADDIARVQRLEIIGRLGEEFAWPDASVWMAVS